jgi:drug/metabolite transporter (DMT)-like permease
MMLQIQVGQFAALGTAICWTFGALCFEYSSKKIGSMSLNVIKMYLSFALFTVFAWLFRGRPFPTDAGGDAWLWLGLSGIIGFVLGDLFLFSAFATIGARTSMLIMSLTPPITALLGFFVLGERLAPRHCLGMAITMSGVATVILTSKSGSKELKHPVKGLLFAFIGMIGQAVGLVLSKYGMGEYNAFSATQIRIFAGMIGFTLLLFYSKGWQRLMAALKDKQAMRASVTGSILGPFLGVYLSLLAIQNTSTGIASTIIMIVPVLIIPFSMLLFKEKINLREIIGAIVAVTGTAIMFS